MTPPSLQQQAVTSVAWRAGARVTQQAVQFVVSILLMRVLAPEDFGLVGIATVFVGFVALFAELGLSAALVQRPEIDDGLLSSIFCVNLAGGVAFSVMMAAAAPVVSAFFGEPRLTRITMVLAINLLVGATPLVHRALLIRAMRFKALTLVEIAATGTAGVAALLVALAGAGVWSLVVQSLVFTAATALGTMLVSRWCPRLRFDGAAAREVLWFGGNVVATQIVNYWIRRADDLLIGKLIGPVELGIYSRAYTITTYHMRRIGSTLEEVMFPALSRMRAEPARIRDVYLRSMGAIALVVFPMMVGLLVTADDLVAALLGVKWAAVVPIIRILTVVGLLQSVTGSARWIFQSQGRPDLQFRLSLVGGIGAVASFLIGIRWGITGVATAYALWSLCWEPTVIWFMSPLIQLSPASLARAIAGPLACSGAMALGVWALAAGLPGGWRPGERLALEVVAGAVTYLGLLHLFRVTAYREVLKLLSFRT